VVAGSVIVGIGLPWTVVAAMTIVQRETPHEMLGRVAASATTLIFAPIAAAIPLGAGLSDLLGHHAVLGICAFTTLALPLLLMVKSRLTEGEAPHPRRSCDPVSGDLAERAVGYPPDAPMPNRPAGAEERTASTALP
jgi:MFS family permease